MKQTVIMILGVQRSGTTALFETLSTAPNLTCWHEAENSEIYNDWYLRPEAEIRTHLLGSPYPVLLKPVRESEIRSPLSLLDEYQNYNLQMIWLYRDPVNVIYSYQQKGWITGRADEYIRLAYAWQLRNQYVLDEADRCAGNITAVRYEELLESQTLVHRLAGRFGLSVSSILVPDSMAGRRHLPSDIQSLIDDICGSTMNAMDALRFASEDCSVQPIDFDTEPEFDYLAHLPLALATKRDHIPILVDHEIQLATVYSYSNVAQIIRGRTLLSPMEIAWTFAPDEASSVLHSFLNEYLNSNSGESFQAGLQKRVADLLAENAPHNPELPWNGMFCRLIQDELTHLPELCAAAVAGTPAAEDPLLQWLPAIISGYAQFAAQFLCSVLMHCRQNPGFTAELNSPQDVQQAITELLRLSSPAKYVMRKVHSELLVDGHCIHEGMELYLGLDAANKDPEAFPEPDVFHWRRQGPEPLTLMTGSAETRGFAGKLIYLMSASIILFHKADETFFTNTIIAREI